MRGMECRRRKWPRRRWSVDEFRISQSSQVSQVHPSQQQQQTPMHAFDLAMKLCTTKHRHSKRQLTPQRPQTTQCNGFSLNYFLAGINNAASHYSVFPVCPNTLPNSTRTSTTSSLQHLGTSARTPLRLAPVGGTAEVRSSATEVAARAAESSSALGVDNRAAGIAGIGNLGGGRRVWRRVLGEGTVTEAALAAGTAVDGLVLDLKYRASVLWVGQRWEKRVKHTSFLGPQCPAELQQR